MTTANAPASCAFARRFYVRECPLANAHRAARTHLQGESVVDELAGLDRSSSLHTPRQQRQGVSYENYNGRGSELNKPVRETLPKR